jgi:hypothetical protein
MEFGAMTNKTKRVRILVVIDPTGKWESVGSHSWSDAETQEQLDECYGDLGRPPWGYHWIEAEIPLPVEEPDAPIEGDVTDAG